MIKKRPIYLMSIFSTLKAFCVTALLISTMASAQNRHGGITGGGGHLVPGNPTPILLDLYEMGPQVFETYQHLHKDKFNTDSIDTPIDIRTISVMPLIQDRLRLWEASSPVLIRELRHALLNTKWYSTPFYFKVGNDQSFAIPSSIANQVSPQQLVKVAYYHSVFGIWLSRPIWNTGLGDMTKAGILIHEALRQIQVRYEADIKEDHLQKLTAYILLANPGQWIHSEKRSLSTLDLPEFLGRKVADEENDKKIQPLLIQKFKEHSCTFSNTIKTQLSASYQKYFGVPIKNAINNLNNQFCQSMRVVLGELPVSVYFTERNDKRAIEEDIKYCQNLSSDAVPYWKVDRILSYHSAIFKAIVILQRERALIEKPTHDQAVLKKRKRASVIYQHFEWTGGEKINVLKAMEYHHSLEKICRFNEPVDDKLLGEWVNIGTDSFDFVYGFPQLDKQLESFKAIHRTLTYNYVNVGLSTTTKVFQDVTADLNKTADNYSRKKLLDYVQDLKNRGIITER